MKTFKISSILAAVLFFSAAIPSFAQDLPNSFNYQAVVNKDDGSPVASKNITVEVSVIQGENCETNTCSDILWQELHYTQTNDFGLFNVEIGSSSATSTGRGTVANYSDIDWIHPTGSYYLRVRVDFGEATYINGLTDLGTSKFAAVPYALVALTTDQANKLKVTDGKIAHKLSELADVDIDAATNGQVLTLDGGVWTAKTVSAGGAANLNGLSDVSAASPSEGQYLIYNSTSKKWEAKTVAAAGVPSLGGLTNVDASADAVATGAILYKDGDNWKGKSFSLNDLSDVTASSPSDGYFLQYNSASSKWLAKSVTIPEPYILKSQGPTINPSEYGKSLGLDASGNWTFIDAGACLWEKDGSNIKTKTNNQTVVLKDGSGNDIVKIVPGSGIAIGTKAKVSATNGLALDGAEAAGTGSIAMGAEGTLNKGDYCIVSGGTIGEGVKNSIAFGSGSSVGANNSFAFGEGVSVDGKSCMVVGSYNNFISASDNYRFVVGGGKTSATKINVFSVKDDGNATLSGSLTQNSDSRLKTNISPIENALDKVLKISGVTFNWDKKVAVNANASTALQYGVIAQDIEKVFPDLVSDGLNGYKSVNYNGLIPVLIQAVKEQQQEIDDLKNTINQLIERIEKLE